MKTLWISEINWSVAN